jgi:DNA polymerase III subunit epsilon
MILVDTFTWKKRLQVSLLIQDVKKEISPEAEAIHGISKAHCQGFGVPLTTALQLFHDAHKQADCVVAHNLNFDRTVLQTAVYRCRLQNNAALQQLSSIDFGAKRQVCTMATTTDILQLPGRYAGYKWPSLEEAHVHFSKDTNATTTCSSIENAHDALADAEACLTVFRGLVTSHALDLAIQTETGDKNFRSNSQTKTKEPSEIASDELPAQEYTLPTNPKQGELNLVLRGGDAGFMVIGDTFKYREYLKSLGATWSPTQWAWVFDCQSMLPELVGMGCEMQML